MKRKKKVKKILNILKEEYPEATTTLEYGNPLEMLIATILSAQSTDKTVNKVTNKLFEKYQGLEDYLDAEKKDLEEIIYPTGFYKKKAEYIKKSCKIIAEEYDCQVPDNMEELLELPGVGRKTANIVLGNSFEKLEGIPVDTHAKRLSKRLGLTDKKYANKIEVDLIQLVPKKDYLNISNLFIAHGREVCFARNPKCRDCNIIEFCEFFDN